MEANTEVAATKGGLGCGVILIIIIVIFAVAGIGSNAIIGHYYQKCGFMGITVECFQKISDEEDAEKGAVVATGTYKISGYYSNVTMNIPLEGGDVTGSFEGTCTGQMKGTYDGNNHGKLEGKLSGTCSPFVVNIPATGDFHGVVNKDNKTAPFYFSGSTPVRDHTDNMTVSWK